MDPKEALIEDLRTLNRISEILNRSADVHSALNSTLKYLVDLMGLKTGWISLIDSDLDSQKDPHFVLAAHYNLPPALAPGKRDVWEPLCNCQRMCMLGHLTEAVNEVSCSRLSAAKGDREGLAIHASVPLHSGDRKLGILNVAAEDWTSFDDRSLVLLTNVGIQMGIALERAKLYDMVRERHVTEQAALLNFSNQLLAYQEPKALMDYFVQEVTSLLKVDACALLLPNGDDVELRFRATYGWKVNPSEESRTVPIDSRTGPGWVMQSQQPLLVEDLQESDPTQWAPDWLRAEDFRGHAVLPLVVENQTIGALVINDRKPRLIGEDELRFLQLMANQAAIAIESARLQEEELARQLLEEEMAVGRQIQLSLLPTETPSLPGWEVAVRYHVARQMGGDFYDFFDLPGSPARHGLVVADVSEKGVPAALFMAMCRTTIRSIAISKRTPSQTLVKANELILKDSHADFFLSAIYLDFEVETGRMRYANGGHSRPLWLQADSGKICELRSEGIILGTLEEVEIEEKEYQISPGDVLLLFTDGVTEASNAEGRLFGSERLVELLADCSQKPAEQIADLLLHDLDNFVGATPQSDDLTLMVLRRFPNP
jgi:sigma-B regulation protein RsbU (phosphoserine phosphatase)